MLGPFDGRRKRSRCQRCATSHLKCCGKSPCSNCERRGSTCSYAKPAAAEQPIIILGNRGQRISASSAVAKHAAAAAAAALKQGSAPRAYPTLDDGRYFYYFDEFSRRNNFSGKSHLFMADVQQLGALQTIPALLTSIRALGALQASKLMVPQRSGNPYSDTYVSFSLYSEAVVGLRESLNKQQEELSASDRTALLWTTLFLGMFELMSESTGTGWLQHMVHGTSKGLEASGPSICATESGARLFQQAKMFELCRTIVFNDRSFLTQPEWMEASRSLWKRGCFSKEWRPLDSLIDIMLLCPDLRYRANNFCRAEDAFPSADAPQEARDIANEGCALREALNVWHTTYMTPDALGDSMLPYGGDNREVEDECALLTKLFWAAVSIYISGEFDYERHHWDRFGLAVPTLGTETVGRHVETILRLVEHGLAHSSLSPLLFLFPIRIAGTRLAFAPPEQRSRVLGIIAAIASRFAVGHAIRAGLLNAWSAMGVVYDEGGVGGQFAAQVP